MDFPKTITLRDKKTETLLTVQDFEYLVDKYMGFEALRFFPRPAGRGRSWTV